MEHCNSKKRASSLTTLNASTTSCFGGTPTTRGFSKVELAKRYPSFQEFNDDYAPQKLVRWASSIPDKCMLSDKSPTIIMLADAFGSNIAVGWLSAQLLFINQFFNVPTDKQLQPNQCIAVASSILLNHPRLKCSEVWVFILQWIGGRFGKKAFGTLDPSELGSDIGKFIDKRIEMEYDIHKKLVAEKVKERIEAAERTVEEVVKLRHSEFWDGLTDEQKMNFTTFLEWYGRN